MLDKVVEDKERTTTIGCACMASGAWELCRSDAESWRAGGRVQSTWTRLQNDPLWCVPLGLKTSLCAANFMHKLQFSRFANATRRLSETDWPKIFRRGSFRTFAVSDPALPFFVPQCHLASKFCLRSSPIRRTRRMGSPGMIPDGRHSNDSDHFEHVGGGTFYGPYNGCYRGMGH